MSLSMVAVAVLVAGSLVRNLLLRQALTQSRLVLAVQGTQLAVKVATEQHQPF
jgi:hypothetical protein